MDFLYGAFRCHLVYRMFPFMYGLYVVNEKKMAVEMKQCIFQPILVRPECDETMYVKL